MGGGIAAAMMRTARESRRAKRRGKDAATDDRGTTPPTDAPSGDAEDARGTGAGEGTPRADG